MNQLKICGAGVKFAVVSGVFLGWAVVAFGQAQPDAQGGAQLGEQSVLAGKQDLGDTKPKQEEPSGATRFAAGTVISVELTSALDSKKVKQGDVVNARVIEALKSTDGRTILARGTKVTGHVTQASAKSDGQSEASLGLTFENAVMKNGEQMSLHVTIQAVAGPAANADTGYSAPMGGTAQGAGTQGTMGRGGVATTAPAQLPGTQGNGGIDPSGSPDIGATPGRNGDQLSGTSHGVIGLKNLTLSESGDGGQGAVLHSTNKNVHLDSGTRMILITRES
jgi:hypothetical protein